MTSSSTPSYLEPGEITGSETMATEPLARTNNSPGAAIMHNVTSPPLESPKLWQPTAAGEKDPFDTLAIKRKKSGTPTSPVREKKARFTLINEKSNSGEGEENSPASTDPSPGNAAFDRNLAVLMEALAPSTNITLQTPPAFRHAPTDEASFNSPKLGDVPVAKDPRLQLKDKRPPIVVHLPTQRVLPGFDTKTSTASTALASKSVLQQPNNVSSSARAQPPSPPMMADLQPEIEQLRERNKQLLASNTALMDQATKHEKTKGQLESDLLEAQISQLASDSTIKQLEQQLKEATRQRELATDKVARQQKQLSELHKAYERKRAETASSHMASSSSSASGAGNQTRDVPTRPSHRLEVEVEAYKAKEEWWAKEKALLQQQLAMAQQWRDKTEAQVVADKQEWAAERQAYTARLKTLEDTQKSRQWGSHWRKK